MLARLEGDSRVADVAQAVERILRQAPLEQLHHPRRGRRGQRRPVRLAGQDARNGVGHRLTGECAAAREQLVDDATERPDVCPLVRGLPASLLRAHVSGGSQNQAGAQAITGERDIGGAVDAHRVSCLGEAEVEHLHLSAGGNLDVRGFQVAVHDPAVVSGLEGRGDLLGDQNDVMERQCRRRVGAPCRACVPAFRLRRTPAQAPGRRQIPRHRK